MQGVRENIYLPKGQSFWVIRWLIANFRSEVRLDDVLRLSGLRRATFARQFKRHSGRTLSGFLN